MRIITDSLSKYSRPMLAALIGYICSLIFLKSPIAAGFLIVGVFVVVLCSRTPLYPFSFLIVLIPFSTTVFFNTRIMGVPGAKPLNLLFLFVVFVVFANSRLSSKMTRFAFVFALIMIAILSISIIRSIPHLHIFSYYWQEELSLVRYLLSHYLKPIIFFSTFIIIAKYIGTHKDFEYILNAVIFSISVLSVFLIYLYIFKCPDKYNFKSVQEYLGSVMYLHANDLVNYYILTFPLILARFTIRKDVWIILCMGISIIAIGILYSRTAYLSILFAAIFYFALRRKIKYLLIISVLITVLIASSALDTIKERSATGIAEGDINQVSSGRTDIWLPLVSEYLNDYRKLFLGNGRYSILSSDSIASGFVLEVSHPHNMYLELILDSGLIGFVIIACFFVVFLKRIKRSFVSITNPNHKEYQYAVFVSLIIFLISGLTGRSLFPIVHNAFLWIILGLSEAIIRLRLNNGWDVNEKT